MPDIDKERDRLDELGEHIEEAEEKARELSEPHVTKSGLPRSFEGSIDRDPEKLTQDEVRDQAEMAPDDRETHREEVELDLMEQHESERGKRLA